MSLEISSPAAHRHIHAMEPHEYSWGLPLASTKRPIIRRTASNSSEASHSSRNSLASRGSEEQFAFSPLNTPAKENPPARAMIPRYATDPRSDSHNDFFFSRANTRRRASENTTAVANDRLISPSSASKPIAIELPETYPADPTSSVTSNPAEPLSARGDIPGGYFPLHEDPESRVRIPHPFHLDAEMARQNSLQRAAESSRAGTGTGLDSRASPPPPPQQPRLTSRPSQFSPSNSNNNHLTRATASPNTPISSYNPSGFHDDVVLPMGKYYPSNWERRHGKSPQQQQHQQQRPSTMATLAAPTAPNFKSESQVPKYHHHGDHAGHARNGSDVKRRLQQYQRDMVAQAAMAAKAVLANSASPSMTTGSSGSGSGSGAGMGMGKGMGMTMAMPSLPAAKLAAAFLKSHKPSAPRLQPLESPGGAVTPMSLEGDEGDCYLTLGGSYVSRTSGASSPFGEPEEEEDRVWMAGLGGKGKERRRGSCASPKGMELGAVSV